MKIKQMADDSNNLTIVSKDRQDPAGQVERGVNGCTCGEDDCEYKQSKLYWHEALDRSHVACDHFYEYVQQHPAVQNDKELEELATKVTDIMQDFYQKVGSRSCRFEDR